MENSKSYVRVDEHGVMRVGNTRVMLEGIIAGYEDGDSPEAIRQSYPSLTLEEVYGAIAFFLGHPDEVAAYLKRQDEVIEYWKRIFEQKPSPVVERIRKLRLAATEAKP